MPTQDVSDFSTPRVRPNIGSTAPKIPLVTQLVIPFDPRKMALNGHKWLVIPSKTFGIPF